MTSERIETVLSGVRQYMGPGRALLYRLAGVPDVERRAKGSMVHAESGNSYLDLGSYGVFLHGHAHPIVVNAVEAQLRELPQSCRTYPSEIMVRAHRALVEITDDHLTKSMLLNSGAEAVEAAIKLCRAATGRTTIGYLEGSYHGKTLGALSITDANLYRELFSPLLPGVLRLSRTDADQAAAAVRAHRPAGLFLEAIQGEGGIVELQDQYLRTVTAACREVGTLVVADEIQCGLGRTGRLWGYGRSEIDPDIVLLGKALGGGVMPVSAVVATESAMAPFARDPLLHSSTFGGNPLAAAAAVAAIEVIVNEEVPSRCKTNGSAVRGILEQIVANHPDAFVEIRGRGCMLGVKCATAELAGELIRSANRAGVLLTPCLTEPAVVRCYPSAFITEAEIESACDSLVAAADEATRRVPRLAAPATNPRRTTQ